MQLRSPIAGDGQDSRVMLLIWRANLDSLWSREVSTVKGNLRNASKLEDIAGRLGLMAVTPALGPYPIEDKFGMKLAIIMLDRSMDAGKNEEYVKFSTVCQLRSAYSNGYHASKEHIGGVSTLAKNSKKLYTTNCPSHGMWFVRFMTGFYK